MNKGKFGIVLPFYGILAFVLAFLGQTLLCGLLLGFVIAAEKDEWASKQVMQAFFLTLFSSVVSGVLSILNVFNAIPFVGTVFNTIFGIINGIVSLVILVFAIIGIVNVCKGKDASVPVFSGLASKVYGMVKQTVYTAPVQTASSDMSQNAESKKE